MGMHRHSRGLPAEPRAVLTHTLVREDVHHLRIAFAGEIDLSTAAGVDAAVAEVLRSHGPRHVDVDLAEVRFIDSTAINALLRCRSRAAELGCRLVVTNPQPMAYRVLEITGVLDALAIEPAAVEPIDG